MSNIHLKYDSASPLINNSIIKYNSGSTATTSSQIYDTGTNVGIGVSNPTNKLQMGPAIFSSGVTNVFSLGGEYGTTRGLTSNVKLNLSDNGSSKLGYGIWSNGTNGGVELQLANTYIDYRIYQANNHVFWLESDNANGVHTANLRRNAAYTGYGASYAIQLNNNNNDPVTYGAISSVIVDNTAGSHSGYLTLNTSNSGSLTEKVRISNNGFVGIGTTTPTAKLDINGSTGYNQLRVRTSYTPTSSADTNGNVGDIAWDNNYVYVKTNTGWGRSTLDYSF